MSTSPAFRFRSAVVGRLRAAGCVFAEDEADLLIDAGQTPNAVDELVARRVGGLPLEQVLGWAAFCGLRIPIDPSVFVPRRRTEFLVNQAVQVASRVAGSSGQKFDAACPAPNPGTVVLDLCCGSGAVGIAIAAALDQVALYGVDIDAGAATCARRNAASIKGVIFHGDLYEPLPAMLRGRVDLIVANAPYVPTESIGLLPAEARIYEPTAALDGGPDGLVLQRRIIAGAGFWLRPGGNLLVETSQLQAVRTFELLRRCGLEPSINYCEDLDATVATGTRTAS